MLNIVKILDATINGNDVPGPLEIIIWGLISISNLKLYIKALKQLNIDEI